MKARPLTLLFALSQLTLLLSACANPNPPAQDVGGVSKGPYLMFPTVDGITVCWVSEKQTTGTVEYAPEKTPGPQLEAKDTMPTHNHRVKLSGLLPYTRYSYSVKCDGDTQAGTFITAAPKTQPFKFVAYGDNRTQADKHAAVLARMLQFHPDFVVQTGDQVASGTNEAQWDEFWKIAGKTLRQTAYYPSLGNHENHGAPYYRFFDVPAEYSFDYGNAHFVALDSNRPSSKYAAQEAWLKRDLAGHQDAAWRIVFFHHTVHTCVTMANRRVAAEKLAARLEPIFQANKVQLVINGHDHDYQRHVAHGITYLVTGGGGAPLYDVKPDTSFVKTAKKAHHHCEITVNGGTMAVRAIEPDGTVIEQFEIHAGG